MSYPAWWSRVIEGMNAYQVGNPTNLPGAVFAAETQQDGRLVSSVGQGWAHNTICNVGSMTKPFTATAVLLALEEHNLLHMEMPVWQLAGMDLYAHDPLKKQVRVRHLLQHTSGLPVFQKYHDFPVTPCNNPEGGPPSCRDPHINVGPTVPWIGSPGYTNECIFADGRCQPSRLLLLDEVSRYIMQTYPLYHQPGTQYSYSSANYIVAARIVEALTGKSLNIYLKEKLFAPLGMSDSFFIAQNTGDPQVDQWMAEGVDDEQQKRVAEITVITQDGLYPPEVAPGPDGGWDKFRRGWRYVYPDGGLYSTADNLLTFLGLLRDGGVYQSHRILSPAVMKLLIQDQGFGHTMGFGCRGRSTPYGQGAGTLEHLGNIMTYFWYDPRPDNQLLGVFLSQRLANAVVNNNMTDGMRVIFRVFIPLVNSGVFAFPLPNPV